MLNEQGKKDFDKKESGIEFLIVFGTMKFGSQALKEWGEKKFFYRTGIALKIWEEEAKNRM